MYVAGGAADFYGTRHALAHGVEANPLQRTLAGQVAAQVAAAGVGCWADVRLQQRGHRNLARALRVGVLALKIGLTARNLSR